MPAKSSKQQEAAGMALACKRGEIPVSELKGSALQMYKSMSAKQLEEFAGTKQKGLPTYKKPSSSRATRHLARSIMRK